MSLQLKEAFEEENPEESTVLKQGLIYLFFVF